MRVRSPGRLPGHALKRWTFRPRDGMVPRLDPLRQGMKKVAIIGAGISGLVCARKLKEAGCKVTVFEKSRSLGGRCATRKWRDHIVDHGAQFWTVNNDEFRGSLYRVAAKDQLKKIAKPVLDVGGAELPCHGDGRYYCVPGNNRLGSALAASLDVRLESLVEEAHSETGKWLVQGEKFNAMVSCAPYPQTAKIFGLDPVKALFAPCLTAFFEFPGAWVGATKSCYGILDRLARREVSWSSCENHKEDRIAGDKTVIVVEASRVFSNAHLENDPEQYLPALLKSVHETWEIPISLQATATFAHRWRFARVLQPLPDSFTPPPGIFLTGDSLRESGVEQVWLEGLRTAERVLET